MSKATVSQSASISTGIQVISFRAECQGDVDRVLAEVKAQGPDLFSDTIIEPMFLVVDGQKGRIPDVKVQMNLHHPMTIDSFFDIMIVMDDTHVMAQSLRALPLEKNSLKRREDVLPPADWTDNTEDPKYAGVRH
jgi:hypothetical protein